MNAIPVCLSLTFLVACSSTGAPADHSGRAQSLQRVRAQLAQGQTKEALAITDELLKKDPSDREALLLAAEGNLALAGQDQKNAKAWLEDANTSLERAIALNGSDADTRVRHARTMLMRERFEEGRDEALRAARLFEQQRAGPARVATAVLAAADCEMQIFVDARRKEQEAGKTPQPDTIKKAEAVLARTSYAKQGAPGGAYVTSSLVYRWLGQDTEALAELERGIEVAPDDEALHQSYLELYIGLERRAECVAAYKRQLRAHPRSAPLHWFLGRAQQALADEHRAKGRHEEAAAAYRDAEQSVLRYHAMQPQNASASNDVLAILQLSLARTALEQGDLDASKRHLARAFEITPRVADSDEKGMPVLRDSFGGTYASGLQRIGDAIVAASTPDALAQGLAYYRSVVEKHPDRFGFMFNNAALTARDLGESIEKQGEGLAKAMPLYEQSYRWYEKAVELAPNDARITNDCGLMLVYHLKRDHARAQQLFEKAIALGEAQLQELPSDAEQATRNNLEEAVGDAWQNLAVMGLDTGKTFEDVKAWCEKAVVYYPYQRREAAQILAHKGKKQDRGGPPAAPAGETAQDKQDKQDKKAAFEKAKDAAEEKAKQGDFDGALLVLDGVQKELKGYAPFHFQIGIYNWLYAIQAKENGGKASQVESLYVDAISQLRKSVELDGEPIDPRLNLARLLLEHNDYAAAATEAGSLLSHARSLGGTKPEIALEAHRIRALAATNVLFQAAGENKTDKAQLDAARESYRELEKGDKLDEASALRWSQLEGVAASPDAAIGVLARALAKNPDSDAVLAGIVDLGKRGAVAKAVKALESRSDAKGLFYLARARFDLAEDQWASGDDERKNALVTLALARATFAKAKAGNAAYADPCDQWSAITLGREGYMHLANKDWDKAGETLLASAKLRPDKIGEEFSTGNSTKVGILILGGKLQNDRARAEKLFREASAAAPNEIDFANNHGLFARDHGEELAREGKREEAVKMWEASYASYSRAVELDPKSVRLANDRSILLLYNLQRDQALTKDWLIAAVERGEQDLAANAPKTKDERNDKEEAIGDALQNLGYYYHKVSKELPLAKAAFEKSLKFYSPASHGIRRQAIRDIERALARAESRPASEASDAGKK